MSKMFLAAGHYPDEPGAGFQGFYEHDEADRWLALIAQHSDPEFVELVPTGTLKAKARWINARVQPGDIAVELHFNSFEGNAMVETKGPSGCVVLYEPGSERGELLARAMIGRLQSVFPPSRGIEEGYFRGDPARGLYLFLDRTTCPAVILEPEFINHRELIQSKRPAGCDAILDGARDYFALSSPKEVINGSQS